MTISAGELLAAMPKQNGARPDDTGLHEASPLADIGITHSQSHRWQRVASLGEAAYTRTSEIDRVSNKQKEQQ